MTSNSVGNIGDKPFTPPFQISPARAEHELGAVRHLFVAYAASLPVDLNYQGFGLEVAELPGKYAPPRGELLLAWDSADVAVACVGMRPIDDGEACEMKRLYVLPRARAFGLGKALTEAVITLAKDRGYALLRLDTLPTMTAAANLYEQMGFHRINAYYGPTPPGTIFMEMGLSR